MTLHPTLLERGALLHLAVAGAGLELLQRLWRQPGSSAYLAGASLLQARHQMERFIGFEPDHGYCSQETALDMAMAAFLQACKDLAKEDTPDKRPLGIALTAAVASNRIPRGDQRAHLAIVSPQGVLSHTLPLEKSEGVDARLSHDRQIADFALEKLESAIQVETYPENRCAFERLRAHPVFKPDGSRQATRMEKAAYFPANFNPMHDGHRLAYCEAEKRIGRPVQLMIEAHPPNKPAIPLPELLRRVALLQLESERFARPVEITFGEPNYLDKVRARPGSQFVAGADAVQRLLQPCWGYEVTEMLREMDACGTRFYVLGRHQEGELKTVDHLPIPEAYQHLFIQMDGHVHISSSELRDQIR
ncbi:hypothetical protein [Pelagicoccus sp. SDUM812003]|uniref:hypothetical protein n=1 Tax=Pelagicoccus sp. SDUM812003 TaxID=3041267 RepID=UPI00280E057C|nr:hypothetical protein [Pelagicoccus sp. SDUM812003]MDQ8202345.1 hypothetical protein [Pelagicoccus sp. SDUM812003]